MELREVIFRLLEDFSEIPYRKKERYFKLVEKRLQETSMPSKSEIMKNIFEFFEMDEFLNFECNISQIVDDFFEISKEGRARNLALQNMLFGAIVEFFVLKSFILRHKKIAIKKSASPLVYRMH